MPLTTTPSERIGLCTRIRRFLVRFIRPESRFPTRPANEFAACPSASKILSNKSLGKPRPGQVGGHQGSGITKLKCCKGNSTTLKADFQERPLLAQSGRSPKAAGGQLPAS